MTEFVIWLYTRNEDLAIVLTIATIIVVATLVVFAVIHGYGYVVIFLMVAGVAKAWQLTYQYYKEKNKNG